MTFFIALFILLMQFLWKYIEDLVGKGLEWYVIAELLVYASASLVPLALPLSVLLSSIMTFGNLAEQYELVACKSAGISLGRVMAPLIAFSVLISLSAFFFSNYMLPFTNLKMESLLYDVTHHKPALSINEKVFYNGIEGFSIRVEKKDPDGVSLEGVMIYDHLEDQGNKKVTTAERGRMSMSEDERDLIITLYNGHSYEERVNDKNYLTHPLLRTSFAEQTVRFDLSTFKLTRTNEELFKDNFQMLNVSQLQRSEDTLRMNFDKRRKEYMANMSTYFSFTRDSLDQIKPRPIDFSNKNYLLNYSKQDQRQILDVALGQARSLKSYLTNAKEDFKLTRKTINRNRVEWHLKFTLSFACLVLFFIGAPLGAIIKKGGLGTPVVVSTLFFLLFHILTITGKKFAQEAVLDVPYGMWMASAFMLPIGIFLTTKAISDSALFDIDSYRRFFKRLFRKTKPL
jgi:lipopolysaccharide export system permease protein